MDVLVALVLGAFGVFIISAAVTGKTAGLLSTITSVASAGNTSGSLNPPAPITNNKTPQTGTPSLPRIR